MIFITYILYIFTNRLNVVDGSHFKTDANTNAEDLISIFRIGLIHYSSGWDLINYHQGSFLDSLPFIRINW